MINQATDARFMLLVDALDEYDGEDITIAELFTRLSESCSTNLQTCVSSRPHVDFTDQFQYCESLRMEDETHDDIEHYVNAVFKRHVERNISYQTLMDGIVRDAQGMFVWVKLTGTELLRGVRRAEDLGELKNRLERMPRRLDEYYQRILDQLDPEDREEACAMLAMVIAAPLPLTPLRLRQAVHFAAGKYEDVNNPYLAKIRILAICGGLLEFGDLDFIGVAAKEDKKESKEEEEEGEEEDEDYTKKGKQRERSSTNYVRLVHRTVYQFLRRESVNVLYRAGPNGQIQSPSYFLLRACVLALIKLMDSMPDEPWNGCPPSSFVRGLESPRMSFFAYALQWWVFYAQQAESESNQVQDVLHLFAGHHYGKWRTLVVAAESKDRFILIRGRFYRLNQKEWPGNEYLYCKIGRCNVMPRAFSSFAGKKFKVELYGQEIPPTFLEFAITLDLETYALEVLEFLFGKHAESNVPPNDLLDTVKHGERLYYAVARGGSVKVTNYLISRGASFRTAWPWGSHCLSRAIRFRNLTIARLFVQHGADMYQKTCDESRDWTPMKMALITGSVKAVALLLDNGFKVNAPVPLRMYVENKDNKKRVTFVRKNTWATALQYVARCRDTKWAQLLLARGADVNASVEGSIFGSALEAALSNNRSDRAGEMVKLLLRNGADPNAKSPVDGVSLIQIAT